jgi:hypothetical protein
MSSHYLIRLETPDGSVLAELQDEHGFVDDVLVPYAEKNHGVGRHIDPYGTTIFNGAQSDSLLEECKELATKQRLKSEHEFVFEGLSTVLLRAVNEVHLRVVFLGD